VFSAMIGVYDAGQVNIKNNQGSTAIAEFRRKEIRADLKDTLVTIAKDNPNAQALYWTILDPLIGE
jgi:hypothetical protein